MEESAWSIHPAKNDFISDREASVDEIPVHELRTEVARDSS